MRRLWNVRACAAALLFLPLLLNSCAPTRPVRPPRPVVPVPPPPTAPPLPPVPARVREIRAVWVSDTTRLDWPGATSALCQAGFNTMYVNLASGGAAFYPRSALLPSLVSRDDLTRGIALAHQRGIAVHAKVIATFLFKAPPDFQQKLIRADRVMRGPDGRPVLQSGQAWLCPSQMANRDLVGDAVREILTRYPVDGLQLDYIRFCEQPSCCCANCRREFEQGLGRSVKRWPGDVLGGEFTGPFIQWKQQVINGWMRAISETARRARPGVIVSAAVFPELNRAREEKAQDWKLWLDRGWTDHVVTMTYSTDLREFEARIRNEQMVAPRGRIVIGIASWKLQRQNDLWNHIGIVRRLDAPGFALFSYDDCAARGFLPQLGSNR